MINLPQRLEAGARDMVHGKVSRSARTSAYIESSSIKVPDCTPMVLRPIRFSRRGGVDIIPFIHHNSQHCPIYLERRREHEQLWRLRFLPNTKRHEASGVMVIAQARTKLVHQCCTCLYMICARMPRTEPKPCALNAQFHSRNARHTL